MTGTRVIYVLLAFILSFMISQPLGMLLGAAAEALPGAASPLFMLAAVLAVAAAQFFSAGFLFSLLSGLPWRRAGAWALCGTALCNFLSDGPSALSRDYFALQLLGALGIARALASAAAAFYGAYALEQREHQPWVEQARGMILSMIGQ